MARQLISGCLQQLSDMGGPMISGVLGQLGSAAYEMAEDEVKDIKDVEKQVEKLRSELTAIQAVLEDAEKRQFKEATVRDWLDKLKDVSHDIDDVLDEWITVIRKAGENPSPSKKVCLSLSVASSWFSNFPMHELVLRRKIASRVKELNEKLDAIAVEKSRYSFNTTSIIEEPQQRPKTTSFVDIKNIRGRDIEEGVLISKLLCESNQKSEGVEIIPIVGMGGIGKTALAQLAYHNVRVKAHFEKVIWICVSEPFDEKRIAKAIIEDLEGNASNLGEMQSLLKRISESLGGKRFLLILDDVWTDDARKWEPLKEALNSGARESKILVTTRKKEVAMMMRVETNNMILIKELSNEICWSIFSQLAFSSRDRCKQLEEIGKKIANKCRGLPLVAKTLGGLMRCKTHIQQWNAILHSDFWELEKKDINVFAPFMLSYNDLPSVEKRCLLYCSVFPKDHVMLKDKLIKLWMSQGYLSNENLEQEGQDCFENLAMRSFFQDFTEDEVGNIKSCKMHDIMRDFVQFLTNNECCAIDVKGKMERAGKKIRHATLLLESVGTDTDTTLSSLFEYKGLQGLRTLFVTNSLYEWPVSLKRLYSNLTCLRSLNLSDGIFEQLPEGIDKLVHLRHLDLSGNDYIEELPNSMCDLFNLQTLDLKDCEFLQQLPKGIGRLVSLRHLCIEGCLWLKYLPKGIAKLSCLRTLDMFVVPDHDFFAENEKLELQDLKMLEHLQGYLRIVRCGNLENGDQAERASLKDNKHLVELRLDFDVEGADKNVEAEILEALKPHPNLETLEIENYMGNTISPNWMMALINLKSLTLYHFPHCVSLPPLGKLPSLEFLQIEPFSEKIQRVGVEFLGIEEDDDNINGEPRSRRPQISFPKLKKLKFNQLKGWEMWELGINLGEEEEEEDNWLTIMPSIQSLKIKDCWRLTALPGFLRKTPLQHLQIRDCAILEERCREGVGEDWPKISHIPYLVVRSRHQNLQRIFDRVSATKEADICIMENLLA